MLPPLSRMLATEVAKPFGVGLPWSMWSVPPLASIRLKLWLPPKTWFQGSQSTMCGGRSPRNGQTARICAWFTANMPWVQRTALGLEVEPEVKKILASVSGPTASRAAARSTPAAPRSRAASGVTGRGAPSVLAATISTRASSGTPMARA